ncbi:hypothetical protein F5I97DRAFT_1877883 [Phlebopus sp. FC_14]|nr:hypothetical protein F5I97DRAFT_1877883 [Phlebopus sp. FC_14]
MSTRVQKGGTIFRPVTRARPRAHDNSSTRPSVSLDLDAPHPIIVSSDTPRNELVTHSTFSSAEKPPLSAAPVRLPVTDNQDLAVDSLANSSVPIVVAPSKAPLPAQAVIPQPPSVLQVDDRPPDTSGVPQEGPRKRRSKSHSLSTTSKKIQKPRRHTTPDAGADPGEELDPTAVTMATLCDDTGHGRVSSKAARILDNHLAWKKSNREKRARMRMMMEAKKYGRNEDVDTNQNSGQDAVANPPPVLPVETSFGAPAPVEDASGHGFDYSQSISTSRYNVQIRIGPSGETIVDEESLFVDRNAEEDTTSYTHVEESDVTKFVNSGTYAKRFRGSRWSAEETELFYDALSQFGENYELISYVLPGRDRKACKNKFKAEDKKNPNRINYCLNNRRPYDISALSRMTGRDFSGPTPEIRPPTVLTLVESDTSGVARFLPATDNRENVSSAI